MHASPLSIFFLGGKAISLLVCVCSFASSFLSFHVPTASLAHEVTLMSLCESIDPGGRPDGKGAVLCLRET